MNVFTGIGRVGKDAVTRHTGAGKPVTGWSLAIDKGWGDNKQTIWLDCSGWGERFEKLGGMILKGDRLGVSGELGTREHDGKTYVTLDVREVTLLGEKKDSGNAGGPVKNRGERPAPRRQAEEELSDEIPFASNRGTY
jgi:single-strand DNA-binding protein